MDARKDGGKHFGPNRRFGKFGIVLVIAVGFALVLVVGGFSSAWSASATPNPSESDRSQTSQQEQLSVDQGDSSASDGTDAGAAGVNTSADASSVEGAGTSVGDATEQKNNAVSSRTRTDAQMAALQQTTSASGSGDDVKYEPGVVLVPVADGQTAADIDAKLASIDGVSTKTVDDQNLSQGFVRVSTSEGVSVEDAVSQMKDAGLESQPNYAYSLADDESGQQKTSADLANALAEASGTQAKSSSADATDDGATPSEKTNDPNVNDDDLLGLEVANVYDAWDLVKTNKSVSVAVLDTGLRVTHEDLKDNIVATYDATVANPANGLAGEVSDVTDVLGHGTHVAGIVSAVPNNGKGIAGVSYNAGIVGVKVFPSYDVRDAATKTNKSLPHCYSDDIVYGYKYVIANRSKYNIRVINMSIQGSGHYSDTLFDNEVKEAYDDGIVTVCSAGNTPMYDEPSNTSPRMPYDEWPANLSSSLVAVMNACLRWGSGWYLSGSSNYNTASETQGHTHKNICALGTNVASTYNAGDDKYTNMTGTSMASPFVAGVMALEFAANPSLTPAQAIDDLYQSATDMHGDLFDSRSVNYAEGWDKYTGYGMVNAYRAVTLALGSGTQRNIGNANISWIPIQLLSGNEPAQPELTVMYGYQKLQKDRDYTVSYSNNTKAGSATATITGMGNYTGTKSQDFTVIDQVPNLATDTNFGFYADDTTYLLGKPTYYIRYIKRTGDQVETNYILTEGVDYEASLSSIGSNRNAVLTVRGKGVFAGQTVTKNVEVTGEDFGAVPIEDQQYTGEAVTPVPFIYDYSGDLYQLCPGVDFTLSYQNNVNVGTAKVVATGIGNFQGYSWTSEFKIVDRTDVSTKDAVKTKLNRNSYTYTGNSIEPTITVIDPKHPDTSLKCQMDGVDKPDYKVSFENNTNVGTAYIVVTGVRGYTGTLKVPFAITPADISGASVDAIPSQSYTGSAVTPALSVKFNGKTLAQGTDYTVSFQNNVQPGTASVVITGKGNFSGTLIAQFTIDQKPSDGSSVPMYRLYNRWSGEHLFTASKSEYDYLASIGWNQEGIAWQSPAKSDSPVYRLYNPYSGDHFYTSDWSEYEYLGSIGWNQEGVAFYSADASTGKPIYRLFNRWLTQGTHLFTTDYNEYQYLGSIGWNQEGIAFYGLNQ